MLSMSKEKLMRLAERALKRTTDYQDNREMGVPDEENFKIDYLLVKGGKGVPESVIAYASHEDMILLLHPLEEHANGQAIWDWAFNIDDDLFGNLEEGYELAGMSLNYHYGVWCEIEACHEEDIEHTAGMQKYLGYCKQHGVTREQLAQEAGYDGMDVMALYDRQAAKGTQDKQAKAFER